MSSARVFLVTSLAMLAFAGNSVLCEVGERINGHEFHRTILTPAGSAEPAWFWRGHKGEKVAEGFAASRLHASYLHVHWAGAPELPRRIVAAAAGRER